MLVELFESPRVKKWNEGLSEGNVDVHGLCCCPGPCLGLWSCCSRRSSWCPWPVLLLKAIWMPVCLCCCLKPRLYGLGCLKCWCLWPGLSPETMLKPVTHTVLRVQVDFCGLCCCQIPCASPWMVLLMTEKDKEGSLAAASMTGDSQLRERHRRLLWQLQPPLHP